jgi:hypothetical protein
VYNINSGLKNIFSLNLTPQQHYFFGEKMKTQIFLDGQLKNFLRRSEPGHQTIVNELKEEGEEDRAAYEAFMREPSEDVHVRLPRFIPNCYIVFCRKTIRCDYESDFTFFYLCGLCCNVAQISL